jgi:hypothetical protein
MASPRHKNTKLWVKAIEKADVREIDENGKPLMACMIVGKAGHTVLEEGQSVPYHSHYIARLKEGSLVAMDKQTAALAGTNWIEALPPPQSKQKKEAVEKI